MVSSLVDGVLQKVAVNVSVGFDKFKREVGDAQTSVDRAKQLLLELLMNVKFTLRANKTDMSLALLIEEVDTWVEMHKKMAYATKAEVFAQALNAVRALRESTKKVNAQSGALKVYEKILP